MTEERGISEQVRRFLHEHISSVGQLETLLLLQMNPKQAWKPAEIARELRTEAAGAEQQLEMLLRSGLVKREEGGQYIYALREGGLHEVVVATAQAYLVRRVTVISLIFEKLPDKLRAFSDAFRLRKERG